MLNIGTTIKIKSHGLGIQFYSDADQILKRKVEFGEIDDEDPDVNNNYEQTFFVDQLSRISKISGLSNTMQIYYSNGLPLLFRTNIGSIGKLSIYIKSKEMIEDEELKNRDILDSKYE